MITRYIKLGAIPEIHSESNFLDRDIPEVEVRMPLVIFWELTALQQKIAYVKFSGQADVKSVAKFKKILIRYVVQEKSRYILRNAI